MQLTSDNGGGGDNYGSACTPAGRTTFDDAAPTLVTAGVAPFVGTFKPEGSLAVLNAKSANGTWRLRITDDLGADVGTLQCWSLALGTEEPVQPPTALSVTNITGNVVTFRWTASPAGPPPDSFVFEGGVTPGQVLASVPTGVPALTLSVPNGAFFVRVRGIAGGVSSGASNELPIYVNVAALPSAPSNLLLTRNRIRPRADLAQHLRGGGTDRPGARCHRLDHGVVAAAGQRTLRLQRCSGRRL